MKRRILLVNEIARRGKTHTLDFGTFLGDEVLGPTMLVLHLVLVLVVEGEGSSRGSYIEGYYACA